MELFKYCKSDHLQSFLTSGELRIGTLYDYRQADAHGQQVGDNQEGMMHIRGTATNITTASLSDYPILGGLISLGENATIRNLFIENCRVDGGDLFIFSTSQSYSRESHERWNNDPEANYDACFRIHSARLFFRAISRVLEPQAEFMGFGAVYYYESGDGLDFHSPLAKLHPGQLKCGKTYGHQLEVRAFWRPLVQGTITPFNANFPEAIKYCSVHARIKD